MFAKCDAFAWQRWQDLHLSRQIAEVASQAKLLFPAARCGALDIL
jgi:hypothetical protein